MRLSRIGEQFVNDARENGSYTDRTGNLRSSIGYVILKNGQQIGGGGFKGGEGERKGNDVLNGAKARYPVGYVLIVVAGMDYAAAVESKGRDVLSGSAPAATERLKKAMAALTRKIGQMQ